MAKAKKIKNPQNTQTTTKFKEYISQGDIFKDVEYIEYAIEEEGNVEISKIRFPYVMVLTQDCDLMWDYTNRDNANKRLISAIVAPLYNKDHFLLGEHLSTLGLKMNNLLTGSSSIVNSIMENKDRRYHSMSFDDETLGMTDMVMDFKHYFTVNLSYLEDNKNNRVCRVSELYREQISHRFAHFLSRIGLPDGE
jgi:hypothetical protein